MRPSDSHGQKSFPSVLQQSPVQLAVSVLQEHQRCARCCLTTEGKKKTKPNCDLKTPHLKNKPTEVKLSFRLTFLSPLGSWLPSEGRLGIKELSRSYRDLRVWGRSSEMVKA